MRRSFYFAIALLTISVAGTAAALPPEVVIDQPDPPGEELVGNWSWPGSPNDGIAIDSTLLSDEDPCSQLGLPSCEVSEFPSTVSPTGDVFEGQLAVGRTAVTSESLEPMAKRLGFDALAILRMRQALPDESAATAAGGEQCFLTAATSRLRRKVRVYGFLNRIRTVASVDAAKFYCGFPTRRVFTFREAVRQVEVKAGTGCRFFAFGGADDDPNMAAYPYDGQDVAADRWVSQQAATFACKRGSELSIAAVCPRAEMYGGDAYWFTCAGYEGDLINVKFERVVS